jgi:NADH-quinone oxidoreductase subunit M
VTSAESRIDTNHTSAGLAAAGYKITAMANLLTLTILIPLFGAVAIWAVSAGGKSAVRWTALLTTLVTLGLAGFLVMAEVRSAADPIDYGPGFAWLGGGDSNLDVRFAVGLDGLSVWFFGLSALLMLTAVLVSWEAITERTAGFYALLLLLESGTLGVFAARDIIMFYVFFEFTLIPLFILIGVWGSEDRRYAALKFFLYTLAGSVLTFLGLLSIVLWNYYQADDQVLTFSIPALQAGLAEHPITATFSLGGFQWDLQILIFLALFAGFAIKVPLFPLHTWLPLAHTQAPTAGSVILAGVLLKIGAYGFARFNLPLLPDATAVCAPWILWCALVGIIYGALVALAQTDMKRLIAYSSVSHMGFCMLGLFALNRIGMEGGVLQMVNHGLSTGGLFAVVGMIYERYHTREIAAFGGLTARLPNLAVCLMIFTLSSIGLPGLNGFVGEFLSLLGMFQRGWSGDWLDTSTQTRVIAVLAVSGVVLNAWYMLWLVMRTFFGPLREPHMAGHGSDVHGGTRALASLRPPRDLTLREFAALAPLMFFIFWIGVHPQPFLAPVATVVDPLADRDGGIYESIWKSTVVVGVSDSDRTAAVRPTVPVTGSASQRPTTAGKSEVAGVE